MTAGSYQRVETLDPETAGPRAPAYAELEVAELEAGAAGKRRGWRAAYVAVAVLACVGVLAAAGLVWQAGSTSSKGSGLAPEEGPREQRRALTYANVGELTGLVQRAGLDWVAHPSDAAMDGLYREATRDAFMVRAAGNATWEHQLAARAEVEEAAKQAGVAFTPQAWSVSADWQFLLFKVASKRVWRHSEVGTYVVYSIEDATMAPLTTEGNDAVQRVEWAAAGHRLQFVRGNNVFVTDMAREIQATRDGSPSVFNGIADWVYEEEVLSSAAAGLWAPDASALAFLRMDDTAVPEFQFELFNPQNSSAVYPDTVRLHYPKPGAANPRATLMVYRPDFGVAALRSQAGDNPDTAFHPQPVEFEVEHDAIIATVAWLTDHSDRLLVHVLNREQDHARSFLVDARSERLAATLVREWRADDGAWIEITAPPIYVPKGTVPSLSEDAYIDVAELDGRPHLALFSPLDTREPTRWLTRGDYDVISGSAVLDRRNARVGFVSTQASSITRNIYSVDLAKDKDEPRALSPPPAQPDAVGTYDASFSAGGAFHVLAHNGPDVPWQAVYASTNDTFEVVLNNNAAAQQALGKFSLPEREFFQIPNDAGDMMNAMAMYPPDFDRSASDKYGVLLYVYGGPGSQMVSQAFSLDWMAALVSQADVPDMQWIVVRVDGRGTGFRGRAFRSAVSRRLGFDEPADQAAAARFMQRKPYVNAHRIAIWGWSYGGYVTSRAIERHSDVFRVGMAVAPVTDWRFYDSIYTERYMKTPEHNSAGYDASAVTNVTGFAQSRFLVQHGTGDDNVHLQNTLVLVDRLQAANVPGFEVAVYTDSDHSISAHGVRPALYARMVNFLFRSFHELENRDYDFWRHSDLNEP
ncbi:Dpp4p [Coemansia sp. RSA 552]|nr:Dpp4p [Coemansia sp. RSA 552]